MPPELRIADRAIGLAHPTYFIADIAANHDGDLERAKGLIHLAAEAGADAAKFQNFTAETIVSDGGFRALGGQQSHQASWSKSVFEIYDDASLPTDWTPVLRETCDEAGIHYFTAAYSLELVDAVDPYVPAFKIGSGDITWLEVVEHIATKRKPVLLAAGASELADVERAVSSVLAHTDELVLMQCNTNYTASRENIRFVNLNVLKTFASLWPDLVLGLSDHTHGDVTVLGAVALGARVVEKHFTDDTSREGPDHRFSMTPADWRTMVERTRDLEASLGDGVKRVEDNERETVVLQRRGLYARHAIDEGSTIARDDLVPLRPCPQGAFSPAEIDDVVGRVARRRIEGDTAILRDDVA